MEAGVVVVGNQYCKDEERELTVRKTSHFCPGDGFGAYDNHTGELAFRVDNYGHGSAVNDEVVLMDPAGACIITLRRKRRTLHSRWEGFLGERSEGKKPLFSVHRSSIFCGDRSGISVDVYGGDDAGDGLPAEYKVEGSFAARSCRKVENASLMPIYSASVDERATMDCFRDCQEIGHYPNKYI